jgi:hypothetical protein
LTLRQFYLLLAEFYLRQKMEDWRCYLLICSNMKDPPPAGKLFPSLRGDEEADEIAEDADDESIFRQVAAELVPGLR